MSKTIIIMRHAKTESSASGGDKMRQLTEEGRLNAIQKAHKWKAQYPIPDIILYSTAVRTTQTQEIVSGILDIPMKQRVAIDKIYYANPHDIDSIISEISDEKAKTIAIIGHNNTLTDYLNQKIQHFKLDNLPTSCFVGFTLDIAHWNDNSYELQGTHAFHEISR